MDIASGRSPSRVRNLVLVALGGACVGILTSFGQASLPFVLSPLANSAGSWTLAAFLLVLVEVVPRRGAVLGAVALATMLAGYALATHLRGFAVGTSSLAFWGLASVVVGPALGVGSAWFRGRDEVRIAAAAALIAGILIGEGVYGLTLVAESTPALYWIGELGTGIGLAVLAFAWRLRTVTHRVIGAVLVITVAIAFYLIYSGNLIALL